MPGKFQKEANQTICKRCPIGFYQDLSGQTDCKPCPVGHKCPSINMIAPTPCSRWEFQPFVGEATCMGCPAGFYRLYSDGTTCRICPPGYSCSDGVNLNSCSPNSYSLKGQSRCTGCPKGSMGSSTTGYSSQSCNLCSTNKYGLYAGSCASSCLFSLPKSSATGTFCTYCDRGYFRNSAKVCTSVSAFINSAYTSSATPKISNDVFLANDFKDHFISLSASDKFKLVQSMSDSQLDSLNATEIDNLVVNPINPSYTTFLAEDLKILIQSKGAKVDRFIETYLKRIDYPTCSPESDYDVFQILMLYKGPSFSSYLNKTLSCLFLNYQDSMLDWIKPHMMEIMYRLKPLSTTSSCNTGYGSYQKGITPLDACLSSIAPDIKNPTLDVKQILSDFISDAQTRGYDYVPAACDYSRESLNCFLSLIKLSIKADRDAGSFWVGARNITSAILFVDADLKTFSKYLPFSLTMLHGYYVQSIRNAANKNAVYLDGGSDIIFTIGKLVAAKNLPIDYLIDFNSKEYVAIMNSLPSFKYLKMAFSNQLVMAFERDFNQLSDDDAKEKALKKTTEEWLKSLDFNNVRGLLCALRGLAGNPCPVAALKRGTTTTDLWLASLGITSVSEFRAKSIELAPYCAVEGDPNIGCLASVAMGCYGNSASACSQSYTIKLFRGSFSNLKYCSSYLGYQIRSTNCLRAANTNPVTKAIVAFGLNSSPGSGSTASMMLSFYPSEKCQVSLGGKGFIFSKLKNDGMDLDLDFGDLTKSGNVLQCASGVTMTTTESSC